ncbi:MAG: hypothetical protein M1826_006226 [Phylliscum demangeonii]|nr:MAG: hypothetical protein M1826_006226 [Phylliscum demangeonii]
MSYIIEVYFPACTHHYFTSLPCQHQHQHQHQHKHLDKPLGWGSSFSGVCFQCQQAQNERAQSTIHGAIDHWKSGWSSTEPVLQQQQQQQCIEDLIARYEHDMQAFNQQQAVNQRQFQARERLERRHIRSCCDDHRHQEGTHCYPAPAPVPDCFQPIAAVDFPSVVRSIVTGMGIVGAGECEVKKSSSSSSSAMDSDRAAALPSAFQALALQ